MIIELVSIPVVAGICQAVKYTGKVAKNYIPVVSIAVGLVLGLIATYFTKDVETVVTGVIAGLAASGLYDTVTVKK